MTDGTSEYVLKQIHHEPCDYYTFGDKLASELRDYGTLRRLGIPMPRLIAADRANERILKEYIPGKTAAELISEGTNDPSWRSRLEELCAVLYAAGLNIDYYPTNFVPRDGELYYIDYECNSYMQQWDFEHWGSQYWPQAGGRSLNFRNYTDEDYGAVCAFLDRMTQDCRDRVNWNWARFEWMYEHPEFDRSLLGRIGLWYDGENVVGAAIYDMYLGEAFCGALPGYEEAVPQILAYAWRELRDGSGLGIAACDGDGQQIRALEDAGFSEAEQTETVLALDLESLGPRTVPEGFRIEETDPMEDPRRIQWLFWQGFDHGDDTAEFERDLERTARLGLKARRHFRRELSLSAAAPDGTMAAYCCVWFLEGTDYAYVEPVCTVPAYRGRGLASALLTEALVRVRALGAKDAYVISDLPFYTDLGFRPFRHYTFFWKKDPEDHADGE